jgi:CRISPR-associated protein Cas1
VQTLIVQDFGVSLHKTSERVVVRGPRPRLELIEGGPQLLLPMDLGASPAPTLRVLRGKKNEPDGAVQKPNGPEGSDSVVAESGTAQQKSAQAETPKVPKHGPILTEVPFFRLSEILIASGGVSLSTDLIEECCDRGIRICFLTAGGKPYAMLSSPMLSATVITRREQLSAYGDDRGLKLAATIVDGKLRNQANLLKYFGKYLKSAHPDRFGRLMDQVATIEAARTEVNRAPGATVDEARGGLLALEGRAGHAYWDGVRTLLEGHVAFAGREHRGATDEVNSAFNYGYGILYSQAWGAILNAGLEPFAGFLHVDRPGKPSLVLDFVEEFRQPIVDRAVIATFTKGVPVHVKAGMLDEPSRKAVADAIVERLDSEATFRGKRYMLRSIIQIQARSLATSLRREGSYQSFSWKW